MENSDDIRLIVKIAQLYYEQDMTQAQIARELGIYRTTISRLLKRWNLSPQQCVAIGDSGNDAEMLKLVKYAFAMGNAADSIKAIAGYTTDDNNHDGALNVIQAVLDNTAPFNA